MKKKTITITINDDLEFILAGLSKGMNMSYSQIIRRFLEGNLKVYMDVNVREAENILTELLEEPLDQEVKKRILKARNLLRGSWNDFQKV